ITPYRIVPGGVYGISIIIHYLFGTPVGLTALAFNIPITLLAAKVLGPRYGAKTVTGFILTSILIDGLTYFLGSDPLKIGDEILMSSLYGGLFIGIGVGLIFRARASCGGTDVIAMMISRFIHQPVGQIMIYVDSLIVLAGFIAFKDWKIPLYSLVTIFVVGRMVDVVIEGLNYNKCLLIVSDKHDEISQIILHDLKRGGTIFNSKGIYSGKDRPLIFTVMSRSEMIRLKSFIRQIDPKAFITVMDTSEILGEGFRPLKEKLD
ncbi:MAG TPA: YitT family protein, partial [Clostridiales bacterium]|nr:YitT family protein [Clostridiales bacterium]